MAVTPKRLMDPLQLPNPAAAMYTSANAKTIIKKASLCNSTASNRTATVYIVPSGGAAGATNVIESAITVQAGATVEIYDLEGHVLNPGDAIWASADTAAAVTFHLSGIVL